VVKKASFLDRGQSQLWIAKSYAGYYSCTGGKPGNSFHTRTLDFLVGISSLIRNFDRGKPFSQPMEPRERRRTYAHGIDMGKSFPKSFECNACPTIYVLFWESVDDVSTNANSVRWSWPWFLPEPWLATQLFLATWCQSKSRSLFPWLSPTTQTTFPENLTFSRLDKVVE
jgi:hypothetical protein